MTDVRIYDKVTRSYIGTIRINRNDIRKYEKDFIVVE